MARDDIKPIVRVEDLDEKLRELAVALEDRGRQVGEESRVESSRRGRVFRSAPTPSTTEAFLARAKLALEDEIVIAEEVAGDSEAGEEVIQRRERDLEVAKRALVRLKLPQLRRLADNTGLESRGQLKDVVDRIAREYQEDPGEVARLVLAYEEAREERGLVDRLYAIKEPSKELEEAASRFGSLSGRYIRVGIARWFVFHRARVDENGLWLEGLYRSYSADAKREGEDFELVSVPSDAHVTARIRSEQRFIEVRARGDSESRAIVKAIEWGTRLRHAEVFPLDLTIPEGILLAWDRRSVFMLHFLDRVLPDRGIDIINLTSARFESLGGGRGFSRQPSVRAVALQGQHLFSSRAACELLAEGRGIAELSLDVRFKPEPTAEFVFPIRVSLASDHVSVLTGFGGHSPESAALLHREILRRLRRALTGGIVIDGRHESLARRITRRAESDTPVDRADIFAPPDDWLDEEDDES